MLILKRFSHRHSRTFFIPNYKQRDNPLNECEKSFVKKYENILRENPLQECEKTFQNCFVKTYGNPLRENPLRENPLRENPLRENPMRENPMNECESTRKT